MTKTMISYNELKSIMLNFKPEEIGFENNKDTTWSLESKGRVHLISFSGNSIEYSWKKIDDDPEFHPSSKSFYKNDPCSVRYFLIEIGVIDKELHKMKIYNDTDFDCFETISRV